MKVFINNRNWLTWPKQMALMLREDGHEVIFIDNASTYEPLLDWYSSEKFKVYRLPNLGKDAGFISKIVLEETEPYVYSDPDYDLSMIPKDWDKILLEGINKFNITKAGLSWIESTVPEENPAYTLDQFDKYPQGFIKTCYPSIDGGWINYPCDTSFAVYRPKTNFSISGIRKDFPYSGIHMPWHITLDTPKNPSKMGVLFNDEIEYYFDHVQNSSCTAPRIAPMLKQYKERKLEK